MGTAANSFRHPFNGDRWLLARVAYLAGALDLEAAVETGTHMGSTARALGMLVPRVDTVEIDPKRVELARAVLVECAPNVRVLAGDSAERMRNRILPDLRAAGARRVLFYLDAHWRERWPLVDELAAIEEETRAGWLAPAVVIHDYRVPGTDLGFDRYAGQALDWDYVRPRLEAIFGGRLRTETNGTREWPAGGARRGVLLAWNGKAVG